MGRHKWVYRVEPCRFPEDFPQRLLVFKEAAGFSWRGLARELCADIRLIKRWRNGVKPDSAHLVALFALAARLGLLHLLLPEVGENISGVGPKYKIGSEPAESRKPIQTPHQVIAPIAANFRCVAENAGFYER